MRKTVIALMLVLPILFVLVIFSSITFASLGVEIAANGIQIVNKNAYNENTVHIDLADTTDNRLKVEVLPANASNKGYTYEIAPIEGSNFADITVENDVIIAKSEGAAKIYAISNDGGYRDSINVLVNSSKAYDFDFTLLNNVGDEIELTKDENGNYFADVETGLLSYKATIFPGTFTTYSVEKVNSIIDIDAGNRSLLVPFSGANVIKVTVPNGINGDIVKTVTLNTERSNSFITVNGDSGNIITVERGSQKASFYVETDNVPSVKNIDEEYITGFEVVEVAGKENCYVITVTLDETVSTDFNALLCSGEKEVDLTFTFKEFDFALTTDLSINNDEVTMLNGTAVGFYVVSTVATESITYEWGVEGKIASKVKITPSENSRSCIISSTENGTFTVWVEAYRDGKPLGSYGLYREMKVTVISRVFNIQIMNNDLASSALVDKYTIGGLRYDNNDQLVKNEYLIDVRAFYDASGNNSSSETADLDIVVSDESKATVQIKNGKVYLVPTGTGEVTISFSWKGNAAFGTQIAQARTFNIINNGVEVSDSPHLFMAAASGAQIVLTKDIMLGTDVNGAVLSESARKAMLESSTHKSTYNIEWYKNATNSSQYSESEKDAYLKHVIEFKDNVYGNGHYINAEYFTNVVDAANGLPKNGFFRGPLYFVRYAQIASVAGQDNCAFLIQTDKVKLYGVNLLGCSDESLLNETTGEYDLNKLNYVGTVLEINANNVEIVNCRIRNGRNVLRIYGGNKDGNKYFIDSLSENAAGVDSERINVRIEGCIISQGREFLIKAGANRALRASSSVTGDTEPDLLDRSGKPYKVQTNNYLSDEYFYSQYVMTDITLKDSVLEKSGLFAIGIETNFSGTMLYSETNKSGICDEWLGTGGTSFATIMRLEGDVRIYDWKDISLVDSSTLIDIATESENLIGKLDISAMINFVQNNKSGYENITKAVGNSSYVHGGIALYGGGKNYSQICLTDLNSSLKDFTEYKINIKVLAESTNPTMQAQGEKLPAAAGSQDFRFIMYDATSINSYEKQLSDANTGKKYNGIQHVSAF